MRQWVQGMLLILASSTVNGYTLSETILWHIFMLTGQGLLIDNRKVLQVIIYSTKEQITGEKPA